jgi:hypothetical protein
MNARIVKFVFGSCVILALAAPARAGLLISEYVANELGSDTTGEWIEIYNTGPDAIDLSNYKIGDEEVVNPPLPAESGGMWQFPAGASIPAYGVQVIGVGSTRFSTLYGFDPTYEVLDNKPGVPNMINYTTWSNNTNPAINMANGGDQILLLDGTDTIVDMVSWGNTAFAFDPPLSTSLDGQGQQRILPYLDTNSAADWEVSNPVTPGTVPVPEPASVVLAGLTLGLAAARMRRRAG